MTGPKLGGPSNWINEHYDTPPAVYGDGRGSDYGGCVSIWAPVHNIFVAGGGGPDTYRSAGGASSGTSFAAPLVTGAIARLLGANPGLHAYDDGIWNALVTRAQQRCPAGTSPGTGTCPNYFSGTNNLLVYMSPND